MGRTRETRSAVIIRRRCEHAERLGITTVYVRTALLAGALALGLQAESLAQCQRAKLNNPKGAARDRFDYAVATNAHQRR